MKAGIELKRRKLFTSTMSKNPTARLRLRHRNKTCQAVFTGKPHHSRSLNPYFVLFRAWDWATDAKADAFLTLALALRVLTYHIKVRLQQAISEQSVIIVTRLLSCSRRIKWKEKRK